MRVIIREAAYDDLDRIYVWIAKDRPQTADSIIDQILKARNGSGIFPTSVAPEGHPTPTNGW